MLGLSPSGMRSSFLHHPIIQDRSQSNHTAQHQHPQVASETDNLSTSQIDWNIIILPALGTAIPLLMDQFAGHSPSALVENSNKSFFSPRFSTSAVHFVNPESSSSSLIERKRRMHTSVVPHHSKNKPF